MEDRILVAVVLVVSDDLILLIDYVEFSLVQDENKIYW